MKKPCSGVLLSLAAAVVLALAPVPATAQPGRLAVSRGELQASGAANLYDALAAVRPEWLFLGGDTATARGREQVLVFVNGRHVGNLASLRLLNPASVRGMRF
jgi:hypothetical protein